MGETLDAAVIKQTQEILGKFVKKPPLTDKLLRKPPFKYLHDIVNVIIKETGYLKGLYSNDELISDNIKDRDAKIKFLQSLIDVVKLSTGENISARPSKIVAGQESDKTNELLQILGRALEKKIDSTESVNAIKNMKILKTKSKLGTTGTGSKIPTTKSKSTNKESNSKLNLEAFKPIITKKTTEKVAKVKEKEKVSKEKETKKIGKTKSNKIETEKKHTPEVNDTEIVKEKKERLLIRNTSSNEISAENSSQIENEKVIVNINDNNNALSNDKEFSEILGPKIERIIEDVTIAPESKQNDLIKEEENFFKDISSTFKTSKEELVDIIDEEAERRRNEKLEKRSAREKRRKSSNDESLLEFMKQEQELSSQKKTFDEVGEEKGTTDVMTVEKKPSAKVRSSVPNNQITELNVVPTLDSVIPKENENNLKRKNLQPEISIQPSYIRPKDNEPNRNRRTSLRPPSVRPASARPGAPRRRDKNVEIVLQPDEMIKLGEINVKIENFNAELEDDGENLIIIEDPATLSDDIFHTSNYDGGADNSLQGHLVQQILETQKEFKTIGMDESKTEIEWDPTTARQRQSSAKQVDTLRESLQKLTRSVNPLGKLLDFLQEDIDSMERELDLWKDNYKQTTIELNREKGLTENSIEPMKHQLAEIESTIKEYTEMINTSRANILQNDQKIYKLLTDI